MPTGVLRMSFYDPRMINRRKNHHNILRRIPRRQKTKERQTRHSEKERKKEREKKSE